MSQLVRWAPASGPTSLRTKFWNLRFRLGWALLPGGHKHVSVSDGADDCSRPELH